MALDANINQEIKEAMLSKNEDRLRTLRAIKSAFLLAKTEKGSDGTISEEQEVKILQKLFNQRKESFEIFSREDRTELAAKEKAEMEVIATYLPLQLDDDQLADLVKDVVQSLGATSPKDMGKVMGATVAKAKGLAEGARISAMVKKVLESL